ncbi:helix-turn-helix domain-containing protein [Caballeronia sp. LZ035]|uniref:helix-turn-helix domain-containing protein n=1 Tax=Caballeronia sp. LZ035 TaxID=3038568 RepID=UPI002862D073|nr:helix-turn-helix domain-containing protein [Caballeronia sp. LZ035]MDR5756271.1 helix-turn-helix domain-containing protein [Caballeronia sp. LZ035]
MDNARSSTRFDWQHDRVCSGQVAARLSGQEKEVLRLLVTAQGRVCEREELMDAIWGPRAAYMDDLYLTQLVYRVRKALKPLGLCERIVTLPRMGYRFDAEGLQMQDLAAAEGVDDAPANRLRGWRALLDKCHMRRRAASAGGGPHATPSVSTGLPVIHARLGTVTFAGTTGHLTGFERALLEAFVEQPGVTLRRQELIMRIWGNEENIDVHRLTRLVSRLRRSLEPLGLAQRIVHMPGVGYRFCAMDPAAEAHAGTHETARDEPSGTPSSSARAAVRKHPGSWPPGLVTVAMAVLLTLANSHPTPAHQRDMHAVSLTRCDRQVMHDVFVRDVAASLSIGTHGSMTEAVNDAWCDVVKDLHAAGCRNVSEMPASYSGPGLGS